MVVDWGDVCKCLAFLYGAKVGQKKNNFAKAGIGEKLSTGRKYIPNSLWERSRELSMYIDMLISLIQ